MTKASATSAAEAERAEMESVERQGLSCGWSEAQAAPPGEAREAEFFRDRHLWQGAGRDRNNFQQLVWELYL